MYFSPDCPSAQTKPCARCGGMGYDPKARDGICACGIVLIEIKDMQEEIVEVCDPTKASPRVLSYWGDSYAL